MQTNNLTQRSPEWFTARKVRITGSIAGAILGEAPYMTREQALRSMVRSHHNAPSEFEGNIATEYGNRNEADAVAQFEMETGFTVNEVGFYTYEDWLGASPDGHIDSTNNGLEVKCPFGKRKDVEPVFKSAKDQPHYYSQMQIEMLCTGWDGIWFYQWSPFGSRLEYVERSQEWLDNNLPELRQFYAYYLSELDNKEHLEPLRVENNKQELKLLIEEYDQLSEAIDNATDRRNEIKGALIEAANGKNALIWGRKITKVDRKGNVQYAKVPELKGVDLEPYRGKASTSWRIG